MTPQPCNSGLPDAPLKRPESVLVVIHTPDYLVLLLERCAPTGFWQSVTGSLEPGEAPADTAIREVREETGIILPPASLRDWRHSQRFEIPPEWRGRYPPGTSHNLEHVFSACVPDARPVLLSPSEHRAFRWLPAPQAAREVASWTNRDAILTLFSEAPRNG
ncbi:MAG: dihydroneopterin triphosphate diphosphatase [Rhodocyclaceae bacterium]